MAKGEGEGIELQIKSSVQEALSGVKSLNNGIKDTQKQINSLQKSLKLSFNGSLFLKAFKQVTRELKQCVSEAIDFNESVNKFNVSMGSAGTQATKFQNKIQEAFGTSKAEMMDYQSTFKNIMSSTAELTDSAAEQISESLVKMALDYSSLYNVDQKSAMQKYESAMTGQIRPIRNGSGYDISKNAIVATANSIGVTTQYNDLSEIEKRLLRIITLMNQMKNTGAMQDFARTIEQPANQLKVLKNQLQEIQVWIGNVFIGTLGKALPYINGFLMAVKELIKTFAIFVGYQGDTSTNLADVFESAEESSGGIATNVGSAANAAKELKRQLMGFDKLNVITTNSKNSGGSGGGGLGKVDPAIINALKEYDNLMDNVRMKATDIRDRIMEWLGFTKEINPETGEITWKLKEGFSNLKLILGLLAVIVGATILGKIISAIRKIRDIHNLRKILKLLADDATTTATSIEGIGTKATLAGKLAVAALAAVDTAIAAYEIQAVIKNYSGEFENLANTIHASTGKSIDDLNEFEVAGMQLNATFSSMGKEVNDGFKKVFGVDIAGKVVGKLGEISRGLGNVFYDIGNLLGGNNSITNLGNRFTEFGDKLYEVDTNIQQVYTDFRKIENTSFENLEKSVNALNSVNYEDYLKELDKVVDSNGKVKAGYEDQAKVILGLLSEATGQNITLSENKIAINGQEIDSIDRLKTKIDELIQKRKGELELAAYEELYKEAIKSRQEAYENLVEKKQALQEAEAAGDKEAVRNLQKQCDDASSTYAQLQVKVDDYSRLMKTATIETTNTISGELVKTGAATAEQIQRILGDNYDNWKQTYDSLDKDTQMMMLKMSTDVSTIGNENLLNAWRDVARNSKEEFSTEIDVIPTNIRGTLLNALAETEGMTPEIAQAYTNLANDSVTDFSEAINKLSDEQYTAVQQAVFDLKSTLSPEIQSIYSSMGVLSRDKFKSAIENMQIQVNSNNLNIDGNSIYRKGQDVGYSFGSGFKSRLSNLVNGFKMTISENGFRLFADGGTPNVGEMFVAREAGPELVGRIGSQTSVMNNDQIVQAVSQGVASAVSRVLPKQSNGGSFNIYLDSDQIRASVQKREDQYANMMGI